MHLSVLSLLFLIQFGYVQSDSASVYISNIFQRPKRQSGGLSAQDSQIIVDEHNRYRRMVGASNMLKMYWDPQLAANAQAYANMCTFAHSSNRRGVGENIWAGRFYSSIGYDACRWWYNEGYRCGCSNTFNMCCGHYTQMVWANSNRVGCGFAVCNGIRNAWSMRYLLVCQYSPAGNIIGRAAYTTGNACSYCPVASTCDYGLCS